MAAAATRLVVVVGPTASGKTELGLRLAEATGGEIVSCDSRQVYRGLDIGSAKPSAAEQARARHHLIDVVDPDQDFTAADYSRLARRTLGDIVSRGKLPVVVGGTGLYLRALIEGLFPGPARDERLRARVSGWTDRFGATRVHHVLRRVDPVAAGRIHREDRVRLVRALEVFFLTGRPISEQQDRAADPLRGFAVLSVGLNPGRKELRLRVECRTRRMFERGLLAEVRSLLAQGRSPALRPLQAIGYKEALQVLAGDLDETQAERRIVTATMQYAKRQMTWFRHHGPVHWFPDVPPAEEYVLGWLGDSNAASAAGRLASEI
jgi:tRNA dimethylallyltransferase